MSLDWSTSLAGFLLFVTVRNDGPYLVSILYRLRTTEERHIKMLCSTDIQSQGENRGSHRQWKRGCAVNKVLSKHVTLPDIETMHCPKARI